MRGILVYPCLCVYVFCQPLFLGLASVSAMFGILSEQGKTSSFSTAASFTLRTFGQFLG